MAGDVKEFGVTDAGQLLPCVQATNVMLTSVVPERVPSPATTEKEISAGP
jgi:hypothetical protein